jgi:hypothetical protein
MDTLRNPSLSASPSENGLPLDTVPKKDTHYRNNLGEWVPVGPSAASTPPRPKAHVKFAIIAVAVAALAAGGVVVASSVGHSSVPQTSTAAYKNGYSSGQSGGTWESGLSVSQNCQQLFDDGPDGSFEGTPVGGGYPASWQTNWVAGCVAGIIQSNNGGMGFSGN